MEAWPKDWAYVGLNCSTWAGHFSSGLLATLQLGKTEDKENKEGRKQKSMETLDGRN